ncbi:hypothetical protein VNI00_001379 [Paramarasmius palmivorus]|uniref:Cytochrome P450 n=1 Tax=Paramarasmius palmivorus TaxID=297713 RepID=A0AAW0EAW9_9AGAR
MINPLTFRLAIFRAVLPLMVKLGPAWFRKAIIDWLPWRDAQLLKKAIYTIDDIAWDVLNTRRREYEDGNTNGKDILSAICTSSTLILHVDELIESSETVRFNEEAEEGEKISDLEIVSHITTILFAGHETTAGTLSRILYQMAILPDAQARLRKEVTDARKANGDLDLEALMALPYLDAICKETLRLYPPADQLYRTSNSSAIIPLMYPVQSADGMSKVDRVAIEPHTDIIIPIIGYNRNKDVWGPDAEEWLPERWLKPPRKSVLDAKLPAVYSSMLTFTMGPRACLGYKFAEMEMKLILTMLFERFEFSISPKDEIFWQLGGSVTPVVKGTGSIEPDLPLKVTPLVE